METSAAFIGGMFFIVLATFIIGLFAMNKKIGFLGAWLIGLGIGSIAAFILGTTFGLLVGVVSSLIAVFTSSTRKEYLDEPENVGQPQNVSSVADELMKLNDLKEKGILTTDEFEEQKAKLLNK